MSILANRVKTNCPPKLPKLKNKIQFKADDVIMPFKINIDTITTDLINHSFGANVPPTVERKSILVVLKLIVKSSK